MAKAKQPETKSLTPEEFREYLNKTVKITPAYKGFTPCPIDEDDKDIEALAQTIADKMEAKVMDRVKQILLERIANKL